VLLYFLKGSLPWQGLPGRSKNEKYNNIKAKKQQVTVDELCLNQPPEFKEFLGYIRELEFEAEPDYQFLISLFESCLERHGLDKTKPAFMWNKSWLVNERQSLKESMMRVINKPGQKNKKDDEDD
jgi:hypothetical protein